MLCLLLRRGQQEILYRFLFLVDSEEPLDPGALSNQKAGSRQIDQKYVNHIQAIGIDSLALEYRKTLPSLLEKANRPRIILALKKIVECDDISPDTELGKSEYLKSTFLRMTHFDFYDLLASFVFYGCRINSDKYKKYISEINGDILNFSKEQLSQITFISDTITEIPTPLETSALTESFSRTFIEIKPEVSKINTVNMNRIKLYRLNTVNNGFMLDSLTEFLCDQLDRYALPRAEWEKLYEEKKIGRLSSESKKAIKGLSHQEVFSQIMLYSFMECALHAPKVFNSIEIPDSRGNKHRSAGIYFIPKGTVEGDQHNHLVYGSCEIEDSIDNALKKAFSQIMDIISNLESERRGVERVILDPFTARNVYSEQQIKYLKKIILPSESNREDLAIDSLGVFISYSTDLSKYKDLPDSEFNKNIEKYLDNEISSVIPKIEDEIKADWRLSSKEIFLFFLPLEKAVETSNKVISEVEETV